MLGKIVNIEGKYQWIELSKGEIEETMNNLIKRNTDEVDRIVDVVDNILIKTNPKIERWDLIKMLFEKQGMASFTALSNALDEKIFIMKQKETEKYFTPREVTPEEYKKHYEYQKEIENGERVIVSVNRFIVEEDIKPPLLRVDPAIEQAQIESLAVLKENRNNDNVRTILERLRSEASGDDNLMPTIFDAVKEYATIGEICNVLRDVFGEYKDMRG